MTDLSEEEYVRRGAEVYERRVRPRVEAGNHGRIVAIDLGTEAFEVADDVVMAASRLHQRLRERYAPAQTWFVRIGHQAVHRLGLHSVRETA